MKTLTLRGINDELAAALKKTAHDSGMSVNKTAVTLLEQALCREGERYRTYHDLDQLAGTWNAEEHAEFHESIREFEAVDEDIWT